MIQKISIAEPKAALWRSTLQKTSKLANLAGSSMQGGFHIPRSAEMVIPGGMTKAEAFVYKLTGKIPASVKERWFVQDSVSYKINEGDEVLTITDGQVVEEPHTIDISGHEYLYGDSDDGNSISDIIDDFNN